MRCILVERASCWGIKKVIEPTSWEPGLAIGEVEPQGYLDRSSQGKPAPEYREWEGILGPETKRKDLI